MRSIVHDDLVEIEILLTKIGRSSARFELSAFKEGTVAAKGVVIVACIDRETEQTIPIPNDVRLRLAAILSNSGSTVA